jgi:hypothetical protein
MQTGRCGIHREGKRRTDVAPEFLFKLSRSGSRGQPARAQRGNYFVDLLVPDRGKIERNERILIHPRYLWRQLSFPQLRARL